MQSDRLGQNENKLDKVQSIYSAWLVPNVKSHSTCKRNILIDQSSVAYTCDEVDHNTNSTTDSALGQNKP